MNNLPYDARVAYLESTATQRIDTGIATGSNVGIYFMFRLMERNDYGSGLLVGGDWGGTYRWGVGIQKTRPTSYLFIKTEESFNLIYTVTDSTGDSGDEDSMNDLKSTYASHVKDICSYNYKNDGKFQLYLGHDYKNLNYSSSVSLRGNGNKFITIFQNYDESYGLHARIFYCKITIGGEIVRDFIPVRVGQVGYMYDKISGQLFGNTGTGDFILGHDIPYIEENKFNPINFRKRITLSSDVYETALTFRAITDNTFTLNSTQDRGTLYYSINNGNWNPVAWNSSTTSYSLPPIQAGNKIQFKARFNTYTPAADTIVTNFSSTGQFEVSGNPHSLYYPNGKYYIVSSGKPLLGLFYNCTGLISAENLKLVGGSIDYMFCNMFEGCTNLQTAPKYILSTNDDQDANLGEYACYSMFWQCSSLIKAPEIISTGANTESLRAMFGGCSSLVEVPDLHIINFSGNKQCMNMFSGCTSLKKAPTLPATSIPAKAALSMSGNYTYAGMFRGCTNLQYIKSLNLNIDSNSSWGVQDSINTYEWVYGVSNYGIFVKHKSATWSQTGVSGVPNGWNIFYFDPSTGKYYESDKTTECDDPVKYIN